MSTVTATTVGRADALHVGSELRTATMVAQRWKKLTEK